MPARDICVTFDLWETLFIDRPELDAERGRLRREGLRNTLREFGIDITSEQLQKSYEESAPGLQAIWRRGDHIPAPDQIRLVLKDTPAVGRAELNDAQSMRLLEQSYSQPVLAIPPRLNEEALETLEAVRSRVPKLGLISNTGRSSGALLRELMVHFGILDFFDATVFSDEVGSRKPNRIIFETAAEKLGASPGDIVHIGDDPEADVWGAKQAGMMAILFDYPVPEGFRRNPNSLFALSRTDRQVPDSEVIPDGRVRSLNETIHIIDALRARLNASG